MILVAVDRRDSRYDFLQKSEYLILVEVLQFEILCEQDLHVSFSKIVERLHLFDPQLQVLECEGFDGAETDELLLQILILDYIDDGL